MGGPLSVRCAGLSKMVISTLIFFFFFFSALLCLEMHLFRSTSWFVSDSA